MVLVALVLVPFPPGVFTGLTALQLRQSSAKKDPAKLPAICHMLFQEAC